MILVCHETKKLYTTRKRFHADLTVYKPSENVKEVPSAVNYLCNMLFPSGSFRFYPACTLFEESLIALVPKGQLCRFLFAKEVV
jgi:hypothetical protein